MYFFQTLTNFNILNILDMKDVKANLISEFFALLLLDTNTTFTWFLSSFYMIPLVRTCKDAGLNSNYG